MTIAARQMKNQPAFFMKSNFFNPIATQLAKGATLLTSIGPEEVEELLLSFKDSKKGRVTQNVNGQLELIDSLWQDFNDTHTDLHLFNDLIHIKERLLALQLFRESQKPFIIIDWGCGSGQTLQQLGNWCKKNNITNVQLFGFANQIHPDWETAPADLTFILDVANHLPLYFNRRSVDMIYSIAGLYYLFLPDPNNQKYDMVEFFKHNNFDTSLFKTHPHTEFYLEKLSLLLKQQGELLTDLPLHILDIEDSLLKVDNPYFTGRRNFKKYGEYAYVIKPMPHENHGWENAFFNNRQMGKNNTQSWSEKGV